LGRAGNHEMVEELQHLLRTVERPTAIAQAVLHRLGDEAVAEARARAPVRSGRLRHSIRGVRMQAGYIASYDSRYRALDYGGTITPKKRTWLAVPVSEEAKDAGSPRFLGGPFLLIFGAGGRPLLALKAQGTLRILFYLTKVYKVRARRFMADPWERAVEMASEAIADAMIAEVSRV